MESVVNAHMKNPPLNVGVVIPPDKHYNPVLYSDAQASQNIKILEHDIYEGKKKAKNINDKKTPKSVIAIACVALAGIGAFLLRKVWH